MSSDDEGQKPEESTPTFPTEIVAEILSWLPLKPLLQAILVCKEWRTAILEHHFIHKHKIRSKYVCLFYNIVGPPSTAPSQGSETERAEPFETLHSCDGLMLMRSNVSRKCVIWNPALRLILRLPDPHHGSYAFAFSYIRATRSYRVVSIYKEKESNFHGWEVLTPGHSMAWRRSTIPDIVVNANRPQEKLKVVSAGGAVHCIQESEEDKKIVTLDMETECFIVNNVLSVWELDWDGKLALADIVGQNLELMELEDLKKGRWCGNKKIIPLPFLNDVGFKGCHVVPLLMGDGEIWFSLNNTKVCLYQIGTRKICYVHMLSQNLSANCKLYKYSPSLVRFEGMQPDTMVHSSLRNVKYCLAF